MLKYIDCNLFIVNSNGTVTAILPNPAMCTEVLTEVLEWKSAGLKDIDIINNLRSRTVPPGYQYQTWKQGDNSMSSVNDKMFCIIIALTNMYNET